MCNLDLTSAVCARDCSPKLVSDGNAVTARQKELKRRTPPPLSRKDARAKRHGCVMHLCMSSARMGVRVRASDSAGPVIGAERTFHCSRRTRTEPSNGTRCIRSQRRTACGLLAVRHADLTRRKKTRPGPKQTAPFDPLRLHGGAEPGAASTSHGVSSPCRLASPPSLTYNSNLQHYFIIVSAKQDRLDLCDNRERG